MKIVQHNVKCEKKIRDMACSFFNANEDIEIVTVFYESEKKYFAYCEIKKDRVKMAGKAVVYSIAEVLPVWAFYQYKKQKKYKIIWETGIQSFFWKKYFRRVKICILAKVKIDRI